MVDIKIISTNKTGKRRVRVKSELCEITKLKDEGFYSPYAKRIVNMRLRDGAFCLRDGIRKGFTLSGDITFAQSVTCNGTAVGFVSDGDAVYEVLTPTTETEPGEPVFYRGIDDNGSFVFTTGEHIYLYNEGNFYIYNGAEFNSAEFATPVLTCTSGRADIDGIERCTNILNGKIYIKIAPEKDITSFILEDEAISVVSATKGGSDILSSMKLSANGRVISISGGISAGEEVFLTILMKGYDEYLSGTFSPMGGVVSSTGEGYLYTASGIYPIGEEGGKLILRRAIFTSDTRNIRACFFCGGILMAAVGEHIGMIDDGKFSIVGEYPCAGKNSLCVGGKTAYFCTGEDVARLSYSLSGNTYDIESVHSARLFSGINRYSKVCMQYGHADGCVYIAIKDRNKSYGELYSFDVQSGVWSMISGIDAPKYCMSLDGGMCITSGAVVYFIVPGDMADSDYDESYPIEGEIVLCESDLSFCGDRKRLISGGAKLSGLCESFSLKYVADSGREDGFTYNSPTRPAKGVALVKKRLNVGAFKYIYISMTLKGRGDAAVHDIFTDIYVAS